MARTRSVPASHRSRARKNCALVPVGPAPLLAYATTRDVSAGDEFLTTYGAEYWAQGVESTPRVVDCARETARDLDDVATSRADSHGPKKAGAL